MPGSLVLGGLVILPPLELFPVAGEPLIPVGQDSAQNEEIRRWGLSCDSHGVPPVVAVDVGGGLARVDVVEVVEDVGGLTSGVPPLVFDLSPRFFG